NYPYTEAELVHLMAHDDDPFNRWEAGQRLAASIILEKNGVPTRAFIEAARSLLADRDPAVAAEALNLPAETFLAQHMTRVDPDQLHASRNALRVALAESLQTELRQRYESLRDKGPYSPDPRSTGRRALKNLCLGYLAELGLSALADQQFRAADNMTDAM